MKTRTVRFFKSLLGISLFCTAIMTFWTLSSVIMHYAAEGKTKAQTWTEMLNDGQIVATATQSGVSSPDDLLRELVRGRETSALLIGNGRLEPITAIGTRPQTMKAHISSAAVKNVLEGKSIKSFYRSHMWSLGHAITGQPVMVNGQPHALFLERNIDGPFSGYGGFLVTNLLACALFFSVGGVIAAFERKRHRHPFAMLIDAMKRIAKGDFNISLDATPKRLGHFGILVEGLNSMAEELGQMEKMRQEFISNVSHEIQSPLNSINGFTRALQKNDLPLEKRVHYLDIIETESKRLSKLSDNLLKLTSLESKHHPFEPVRYRLDKQLRSLVLSCEPQWMEKKLEMDISLDETEIAADKDLMSQVWVNLIHNSIKFTPAGGTVRVHCHKENGQAIVEVADTGIGMSNEDQMHVFERFFKADVSRNRSIGGSGLGLSIVKTILDKHHGTVQVRSRLGEGTSFTVILPEEAGTGHG